MRPAATTPGAAPPSDGSRRAPRVTYSGNVHPAPDLDAWLAGLDRWTSKIAARQRQATHPFGVGAWWNAAVAAELATNPAALDRVRAALAAQDLTVWTLNVFPYGGFHGQRVKEQVYRPDWASPARVTYTLDAARALAGLLPAGSTAALSTLPLGHEDGDRHRMVENLRFVAAQLSALEARTGVRLVLALEPEPCCLLETVAAAVSFLERELLAPASEREGRRRHLGLCVDLCHLAVVGEDPLAALHLAAAAGIEVAKIQVSSALELRDPAALSELLAFDEPCWLHQTFADHGARALDLAEVRRNPQPFAGATRIRSHFHLPIWWDADGPLGSTRAEVERVLAALGALAAAGRPLPLLEVETYTWGVLQQRAAFAGSDDDLVDRIAAELQFVHDCLRRS